MTIESYEIITLEEFESILRSKGASEKYPGWLSAVRRLPCMRKGCNQLIAGTVHHVFEAGMARKCDDHLGIPLCIDCHVTGDDPVQKMGPERFEIVIGMSQENACRRVFTLITDKYYSGEFTI